MDVNDIYSVIKLMHDGFYDEMGAAYILDDMMKQHQNENSISQSCEICNIIPWADDGKLRIAAFCGHKIIDAKEAFEKYDFHVDLNSQTLEAAECCGSIECENILGNVSCGGNIQCQNIAGNAKSKGNISCNKIGGNACSFADIDFRGEDEI